MQVPIQVSNKFTRRDASQQVYIINNDNDVEKNAKTKILS